MRYKIFARYINGEDRAPATARKTDKVYLIHEELTTDNNPIGIIDTESDVDSLLSDALLEEVADTVALAEELIAAATAEVTE